MYVAGLDSGTFSVDIVALEDESLSIVFEESLPRATVSKNPAIVVDMLEKLVEEYSVESIVVSSGYGVPLKRAGSTPLWEIELATFLHPVDEAKRKHRIIGLRRIMELVRERGLPAWFTPGVVHLDSVPDYRKINKIDLGTSDKIYSVAYVLREEVEERRNTSQLDLIVVEVGYAYTAAIAVKSGRIIDGLGGTSGFAGYMGAGCWDAETAYLVSALEPSFYRERLFEGGYGSYYLGSPPPSPREVESRVARGDSKALKTVKALAEATAKSIYSLLAVVEPRVVYVTGRWARSQVFFYELRRLLNVLEEKLGVEVRRPKPLARKVKEAAIGAALIASGLAGGKYKWLVDMLGLDHSSGTILDYIAINKAGEYAKNLFIKQGSTCS